MFVLFFVGPSMLSGISQALLGSKKVQTGNNIINSNPLNDRTALAGQAVIAEGEMDFYAGLKQATRTEQHVAATRNLADAARGQGVV